MLTTITVSDEAGIQTQLLAAIVLKNTLRNHIVAIKAMPAEANAELGQVKNMLGEKLFVVGVQNNRL
jgi:hypothetical protein